MRFIQKCGTAILSLIHIYDGVPVEYHVTFWKSELIDFVILQQDAFDEIGAVTPMERQEEILNMVCLLYTSRCV